MKGDKETTTSCTKHQGFSISILLHLRSGDKSEWTYVIELRQTPLSGNVVKLLFCRGLWSHSYTPKPSTTETYYWPNPKTLLHVLQLPSNALRPSGKLINICKITKWLGLHNMEQMLTTPVYLTLYVDSRVEGYVVSLLHYQTVFLIKSGSAHNENEVSGPNHTAQAEIQTHVLEFILQNESWSCSSSQLSPKVTHAADATAVIWSMYVGSQWDYSKKPGSSHICR